MVIAIILDINYLINNYQLLIPIPYSLFPIKLWIDFGELGIKKSSAGLTKLYTPQDLVGKIILAVTNLPPRQVANFMSEVLVLGVVIERGEVALVQPDRDVPIGLRIL
ncbi:MAG: tRNA-binding protein [Trichodesmium sp.]